MDKTFLHLSISVKNIEKDIYSNSEWSDFVESIEGIDGVSKEAVGQKGLPGSDMFAIEVAKAGLFTKLAEIIGGWLIKDRRRRLKLRIGDNEIEIFDIDEPTQEKLIEWFTTQVGFHLLQKRS